MTKAPLHNLRGFSDAAWFAALDDYRHACDGLRLEAIRARGAGDDINPRIADAHGWAARALIEAPATRLVHIVQKIRTADNLLNLAQLYPTLPEILLTDIFSLMGLETGDQPVLPPPVR